MEAEDSTYKDEKARPRLDKSIDVPNSMQTPDHEAHIEFMRQMSRPLTIKIMAAFQLKQPPRADFVNLMWVLSQNIRGLDKQAGEKAQEKAKTIVRQRKEVEALRKAITNLSFDTKTLLYSAVDLPGGFRSVTERLSSPHRDLVGEIVRMENLARTAHKRPVETRDSVGPTWGLMDYFLRVTESAAKRVIETELAPQKRRGRPDGDPGISGERNHHFMEKLIELYLVLGLRTVTAHEDGDFMKWVKLFEETMGVKVELNSTEDLLGRVAGTKHEDVNKYIEMKVKELGLDPPDSKINPGQERNISSP